MNKGDQAMRRIEKSVNYIAAGLLGLCIIFGLRTVIRSASGHLNAVFVIAGAVLALEAALALNRLPEYLRGITVCQYRRITLAMCLTLLTSAVLTAVFCDLTPKNDLSHVCTAARNLIEGRCLYTGLPEEHQSYFAVYPNNHALFSLIYVLYRIEFTLTGSISDALPTAVNIAGLSLSYWLMCRCAEFVYPPERAILCAVRGMLFTPFITYAAFFYTDSMGMLPVAAAAYFYLKFRKSGGFGYLIACGVSAAAAYKIKGSAVILIIAIMLDMAADRRNIREFSALGLPCLAVCGTLSFVGRTLLRIGCAELREKRFPLIHWIMMSADGRGGYVKADFLYTQSFSGCKKVTADLSRLWEKLSEQGISGFLAHLGEKMGYAWGNCTFLAGYYYTDSFQSPLFLIFTFFCHFTLLFSILLSLRSAKKEALLFRLTLAGTIVFFLLWETRCRYLVSLFPLFMLI